MYLPKDVWVEAPPAVINLVGGPLTEAIPPEGVSKDDIIQMQQAEIRALRSEIGKMQAAANTIANTAAALAWIVHQDNPSRDWVIVPRDVRDRMKDKVQLQVRPSSEGTMLRCIERAPDHLIGKGV